MPNRLYGRPDQRHGCWLGAAGDIAYVIAHANANTNPAGSLIQFAPEVFATPQTITLQNTLVLSETRGPEVIDGPGANLVTISGNNAVQVLQIDSNVMATVVDVTISGGFRMSASGGGGIVNMNMGALTVTGSILNENSVSASGGGIDNHGTMRVINSTISSNSADIAGGGICNEGTLTVTGCTVANNMVSGGLPRTEHSGGGIFNGGTLTVTGCTVANNTVVGLAASGGGICAGTGISMIAVSDSTIAGNSADSGGGGILGAGTLTVVNSTIAGNYGGGIYAYGTLTAVNSTIADNTVTFSFFGGGLTIDEGTATLYNTIVALNTYQNGALAGANDIASSDGGVVSPASAHNLIGTGGSGGLTNGVNGNQVGIANPGLGLLANNGGPTQTIALLSGSPAIDAGSVALAADPTTGLPLTTDQRGAGYARTVDGAVDIGAFEFGAGAGAANAPPMITSEQILAVGKGKKMHLTGFELVFSEALNGVRARKAADYGVTQTVKRGGKLVAQRVKLQARYNQGTHAVRLILSGRHSFALGGQLVVNASAPNGITNASGVYLAAGVLDQSGVNPVFVILADGLGLAD